MVVCTGIRIHNVRLAEAALRRTNCGTFHLSELIIAYIELQLPSWRRPLRIHMRGIKADLRQRQMPQVPVLLSQLSSEQETCIVCLAVASVSASNAAGGTWSMFSAVTLFLLRSSARGP